MNESLARAVAALNRRFYESSGRDFEATRHNTWPGFERAVASFRGSTRAAGLTLLDLGCGNGRFARFLCEREPLTTVVGIDASETLLRAACESFVGLPFVGLRMRADFIRGDLLADCLPLAPHACFDRVALIGVLHHVPTGEQRLALLRSALGRVRAGGFLVVTLWQVAGEESIEVRTLGASEASRVIAAELAAAGDYALGPGDRLVTFGVQRIPRFVHECDAIERSALLEALPARLVAEFTSDGRSGRGNVYWVLTPSVVQ